MTHALLILNALALAAVIALNLLPGQTPLHSLDYHASMQARPAVLGLAPDGQQHGATSRGQGHYSF